MLKKVFLTNLFLFIALFTFAQNEAGEFPADVQRNYDELLTRWSNNMKYADDCRSLSDNNVTFSDDEYIKRLYSLPTTMELVYNPFVKAFIERYAGRMRRQVSYMLGEGKYYFPMFEEALEKEGMPLELKYLAVIESALNPVARSRVGATGLWQFMPATGKMYNLEVNSLVDERCDPHKSTAAAARYLKDLYSIFKDWNLAIAAYNCGPGNINKAIKRSGGQTDFWSIYPYLPRETRDYVPIFIAATYIMNYYQDHNICPAQCEKPAAMDSIVVNKNIHLQQIAEVLDISIEDLRKYNPQYRNDIVPGSYKPYAINLPIHKVTAFIGSGDAIYNHKASELLTHRKVAGLDLSRGGSVAGNTHRVKRGDTLSKIAKRYGTTVTQIKKWNGLKSNYVAVGKYLRVSAPVAASSKKTVKEDLSVAQLKTTNAEEVKTQTQQPVLAQTEEKSEAKVVVTKGEVQYETKTETTYYKIRRGDTWNAIAKKNNASISDIKKWNNMKSNKLIAGKTLKIQKTIQVEIPREEIVLSEPEVPIVEIDSTYTVDLIDDYLKKLERDEASLPLIKIGEEDNTPERKKSDNTRIIYHKVRIGETITQIAAHYNVSKKDIVTWNKLSSNTAKVGQRLMIRLPEGNSEGPTSNNSQVADQTDKLASGN